MTGHIEKIELAYRLSQRMNCDEATAAAWLNGFIEVLYESLRSGESITLKGLGGFYVKPTSDTWVFKFNPAQRLRAAFGWSSTHKYKP